ncbi:MAG: FAD-dependent oxidoreductase [Deltaproteobacteria bacterium]|nr:FAD-dependent oxidoreductase [Deltaproteobacteria bacterium]
MLEWPYPVRYDKENEVCTDVLILGGGIAGCWAAISAARKGVKVVLVDKSSVTRSGAGGSGCDHWQFAATNPACKLTPGELARALVDNHGGWNCGIHRYIQCREGYDTLLELEKMGVKIRDSEGEFEGADFRDEQTGFLFGYDYVNRYTLRFWGSTAKPLLEKECERLKVKIYKRVMTAGLLTENGKQGARVVGATGFNVRTGEFHVFKGKATVLCLSRPEQMWAFSTELTGLSSNFGQSSGDGHAMAWRAGAEFTLMERSAPYPGAFEHPYDGYGRPFAEWHAATIVDSNGKEIPYVDRDGRILTEVRDRYRPSPGQKFFLLGGGSGEDAGFMGLVPPGHPSYEYMGPSVKFPEVEKGIVSGEYVPPLYADLTSMPEKERRVIFGLSVAQDGKTDIAVYANYTEAGFDPDKDMIQCISKFTGTGPPQWRAVWMNSGGLVIDWDLKTNLEGLYAAGQQMYASEDHANAATSGRYAGRRAAVFAMEAGEPVLDREQVNELKHQIYAPVRKQKGIEWKELNAGICRVMQDYCGALKNEQLLKLGLKWFDELREGEATEIRARNPHELMRCHETLTALTCGEMIMHACLARKASNSFLNFTRLDYPEVNPPEWHRWITTRLEDGDVRVGELPIDYWGSFEENYEAHCGLF